MGILKARGFAVQGKHFGGVFGATRAVAQGLSAFWRPLSDSELERDVTQETASRGPAPKPDEAQARKSQTREPIQSKLAPILKEALQI